MKRVVGVLISLSVYLAPSGAVAVPGSGAEFDLDFKKAPTFIDSDSLTLKSNERSFVYQGNVKVVQGDMTLVCEELQGTYSDDNRIQKLVALRQVRITKGDKINATGNRATYTAADATLLLTENPTVEQSGSVLAADRIRIFLEENRSVAEGRVKVKLVSAVEGDARANPAADSTPRPPALPADENVPGVKPLGR